MGKNPPKWLPGERVKETILLQRKSVEQLRADQLLRRDKLQERRDRHKAKIDSKRKKKLDTKKFISAQTILKHAQRKQGQSRAFAKIGEKVQGKNGRLEPEELKEKLEKSKIVLVVRAKGKLIPPEVAAGFRRLGLIKLYSARLICLNKSSEPLVQQLKPFSFVGAPESAQLEELVRTRGYLWDRKAKEKRIISGNQMLEMELGKYGILCVEDLCDAITQKSTNVEEILRHIAPFDFHPPHQLFLERHRSVHQKLEVVNTASFAAYLAQQLKKSIAKDKKVQKAARKTAAKKSEKPSPKTAAKGANKKKKKSSA